MPEAEAVAPELGAEQLQSVIDGAEGALDNQVAEEDFAAGYDNPEFAPEGKGSVAPESAYNDEETPDNGSGDPKPSSDEPPDTDKTEARFAALEARLRKSEGKNGELIGKLKQIERAKSAPVEPKKKALSVVIDEDASLSELRTDEPEQAKAMARVAEITAEHVLASTAANVDARVIADAANSRARDMGKLDDRHEGWQDTISTPEFLAYAYKGGPNTEEQAYYRELRDAQDPSTSEVWASFETKYPEWGKDRGRMLNSGDVYETSQMLSQFDNYQAIEADKQKAADGKKSRLAKAAAPTKSTSTPQARRVQTAEEDLQAGYEAG